MLQKLLSRLCIMLSIMAFGKLQATAQDWVKYQSPEMKFSINFPLQPQEQSQDQPTAAGNIKLNIIIADLSSDPSASNYAYAVNYSVFPSSISSDSAGKTDAFFEGAINGMATNTKGTVLSKKRITYKTYPAEDIKVELPGQGIITAKLVLIHNRFYVIMVISALGKDDNADITKFINSFESEG